MEGTKMVGEKMRNGFWKLAAITGSALIASPSSVRAEDSAWVSIIPTGTDLTGWTPKFEGKAAGTNPDTTFRMSPEGYLWVDLHTAYSRTGFGHLYYTKQKFSYYMVRAEYKFTKDKSEAGFADWTHQNNGLMIHCPEPSTVTGQFPNSIEVQLLGPKNTNEDRIPTATWPVGRTGAMCIAGDAFYVNYNGNNNYTNHCTSPAYPDAWKGTQIPWDKEYSEMTVRVLGDSLIQHIIRGQKVFESAKIRNKTTGAAVKDGYLAIQAEGTATMFKKIEVLSLIGCMDNTKAAYRSYFVKDDPSACAATGLRWKHDADAKYAWTRRGTELAWGHSDIVSVDLFRADGSRVGSAVRGAQGGLHLAVAKPGMYWARLATDRGVFHQAVSIVF
jgi:hypothetical protein